MRSKLAGMVLGAGLVVAAAAPVWAHHAFAAEFDANKPIKFKATLIRMEWTNPHSWLHVAVKQPDGTVVEWALEAGNPNALFRRGFTKEARETVDRAYRILLRDGLTVAAAVEKIRATESGSPEELLKKYGMVAPNIVTAAHKVLSRK